MLFNGCASIGQPALFCALAPVMGDKPAIRLVPGYDVFRLEPIPRLAQITAELLGNASSVISGCVNRVDNGRSRHDMTTRVMSNYESKKSPTQTNSSNIIIWSSSVSSVIKTIRLHSDMNVKMVQ